MVSSVVRYATEVSVVIQRDSLKAYLRTYNICPQLKGLVAKICSICHIQHMPKWDPAVWKHEEKQWPGEASPIPTPTKMHKIKQECQPILKSHLELDCYHTIPKIVNSWWFNLYHILFNFWLSKYNLSRYYCFPGGICIS